VRRTNAKGDMRHGWRIVWHASWSASVAILGVIVLSWVTGIGTTNPLVTVVLPLGACIVGPFAVISGINELAHRARRQIVLGRRSRACSHCGYSLKGNVSGTCPECGSATEGER
jgi:hypothetical protein